MGQFLLHLRSLRLFHVRSHPSAPKHSSPAPPVQPLGNKNPVAFTRTLTTPKRRIYETKGLSLEQVDELYAKVDKAYKSPGFVPSVSWAHVQEGHDDGNRHLSLADRERKYSVHQEIVVGKS